MTTRWHPREALEATLRRSARVPMEVWSPGGCMVVLSASTMSPDNAHRQSPATTECGRTRDGTQRRVAGAIR